MAEDTADKDLQTREIHRNFSQRIFSRVPFLSDWSKSKEPDIVPQWYQNALEGMNPKDQQAVRSLRSFFTEKGRFQRWYYSGSGEDISPTIIAPHDTEHWMVDVGYDATHRFFHSSFNHAFSEPYQKLGGRVEIASPWDEGWRNKRQTVEVDGKTKLQIIGGETQDRKNTPPSIDVIYTNPYSTNPGPDAWIALKTHGYYVIANNFDHNTKGPLQRIDKNLEDFGIRKIRTFKVDSLHFPKAGKVAGTTDGKPIWYQVYEKSRPFTPEEEDMLQLDSSLWEIDYKLDYFVFHYDMDSTAYNMPEGNLSAAFARYFYRTKHLKGNSKALLQQVQAYVDSYFPKDGTLPDSICLNHMFEIRDERDREKTINGHHAAAAIYKQAKVES